MPLLVARAYTAAANYEAALDWYQRVYDYQQPPGQRAVYAGLDSSLETNAAPDLTFQFSDYTNFNPHLLAAQRPNPYTRYTLLALAQCFIAYGDSEFTRGTTQSRSRARALYDKALELAGDPALRPITPNTAGEGAYPLPDVAVVTTTADTQLSKLRQGLTIAGLPAPAAVLADTASPVHPSQYRYKTLLARAQQLVGQAQQIEAQYLAALEKQDAKALQVFDAQQALELAGAQVTLQQDRVQEANDNQRSPKPTEQGDNDANQLPGRRQLRVPTVRAEGIEGLPERAGHPGRPRARSIQVWVWRKRYRLGSDRRCSPSVPPSL